MKKIDPIRTWMQAKRGTFTIRGLDMPHNVVSCVRSVIGKMVKRGELIIVARGTYRYNHQWRALPSARRPVIKTRILRAIYYANGTFRGSYVMRTAESPLRHTRKVIYWLVQAGYIRRIKNGLFVVADRDRYRIDLL